MDPMTIFFIIWLWVLPILGITLVVAWPLFWFFIVPAISRKLTWARFGSSNIIALSDDSGWTELVASRKGLPEGVIQTERGFHFLPTPSHQKDIPESVNDIVLKKSILRGLNKPFWHGYVGQIELINPTTTAALTQSSNPGSNPNVNLEGIESEITNLKIFTKGLDKTFKNNPLSSHIKNIETALKIVKESLSAKKINYVDPKLAIKTSLPQMFPPTQIAALARNREEYGRKMAGKDYGKLILGAGLILGLVIIAILLVVTLGKAG